MQYSFRRVVTGHADDGLAVVKKDEILTSHDKRPGYCGVDIWCTDRLPVSNNEADYNDGERGINGSRVLIRTGEMEPGGVTPRIMHRTETLDYAVILSGECDMELDGGEFLHLKAGDVVVQRGTNHAWTNTGSEPVRFLFVLIDALPVQVGDKVLGNFRIGEPLPAEYS